MWEDTLSFEPERQIKSRSDLVSFITDHLMHKLVKFEIRRRSCIAGNLGSSMNMLISRIIQAFDLSIPSEYVKTDSSKTEEKILFDEPLIDKNYTKTETSTI